MEFSPTGNSGGGGVGGNAVTSSFLLQPGVYQIQFKTEALYLPNSQGESAPGAQGVVIVAIDGQTFPPLTRFVLTGITGADAAVGAGSKLFSAGPNQTLTFVASLGSSSKVPGPTFYQDCYMTLLQLR